MSQFKAFTGRNLKIYLRDKAGVFFSLLTMVIIIVLMLFFLGDMSVNSITKFLGDYAGRDVAKDKDNATCLILAWTSAGIIPINAITVTVAVYSNMIKDKISGKLNSIYTAPINRSVISMSYVATAWMASVIICTLTLVFTEFYCVSQGLVAFSTVDHIKIFGMICLNSFTYATIMFAFAMFINTESAWSGFGTVVGTIVGFLGAIYIPIGGLSDTIVKVLKCTPVLYSTVMFRTIMVKDIMKKTFDGIESKYVDEFNQELGNEISLFNHKLTVVDMNIIILAVGILFLTAGVMILKYGKKKDR